MSSSPAAYICTASYYSSGENHSKICILAHDPDGLVGDDPRNEFDALQTIILSATAFGKPLAQYDTVSKHRIVILECVANVDVALALKFKPAFTHTYIKVTEELLPIPDIGD